MLTTANPSRFDPYKAFHFRVKWAGRYVAGISTVGGLTPKIAVVEPRRGGASGGALNSPGRTEYEALTLERGVTHDTEFEQWATSGSGRGSDVSLTEFRKDLIIEVYGEAGQVVAAYQVYRAWVSEYQALPDIDAGANAVVIQHLKLENEGWERDPSVVEPPLTNPAN